MRKMIRVLILVLIQSVSPTHLLLGVTFKTDGDRPGQILVQLVITSMSIKTTTMILMPTEITC